MEPFDALWLAASVRLATPVLLAALGELISERAGVLNIGLEGMMLMGAFWSYWASWLLGSVWLGVLAGAAAGVVLASLMALLAVRLRADQIVVGIGLNLLALGTTTFAYREIFGSTQVTLEPMRPLVVPVLSEIPFAGDALFRQIPLVYPAYLLVPAAWYLLYRTNWGLALRSAGEAPAAADTAGINVRRVRQAATLVAGAMAGIGGAFLSLGELGFFTENMSAGRGYLALAAVIFGAWRPWGVLAACLLFGAADALQLRLQAEPFVPEAVWLVMTGIALGVLTARMAQRRSEGRRVTMIVAAVALLGLFTAVLASPPEWSLPTQVWLAIPYLITLVALAGVSQRSRAPSALAEPYVRGGAT